MRSSQYVYIRCHCTAPMLVTHEEVSVVCIKGILLNLEVKAKHVYASCLSSGKKLILVDGEAVVQMYMRQCI